MTINHSNRKLSALLFCAVLTTNMPLFCPAGHEDYDVELSEREEVKAALIPKKTAAEHYKKVFGRVGQCITTATTAIGTSVSNNSAGIKKVLGCTFLVLLSVTAGGFVMYEIMDQPPASVDLNPVAPCNITVELNPHDLPHCYGVHTDNTERALLSQKEYQDLLVAVAACKAEKTDDCADVCSSHHTNYTFGLKKGFYYPCPKQLPAESNFALCPVKLEDMMQGCDKPPADAQQTPLENLRNHTPITGTSDCSVLNLGVGFSRDKIGVAYPEVRPEEGQLPHQRHRFSKDIVATCKPLRRQIKKSEKRSGCSAIINE